MNYRKKFKEYYNIELSSEYDIHHINLNHNDDDISNLMILPKKLHQEYHNALADYSMFENGFITVILGFTDGAGTYNDNAIKTIKKFYEVYLECQKWKDYKKFLDGEIPNIHNLEV